MIRDEIERQILRERPCSIEGCHRPLLARGVCGTHWQRKKMWGTYFSKKEVFIRENPPKNGVGKIPLTKGKYALVDEGDYYKLIKGSWHLCGKEYAKGPGEKLMHDVILNATNVDHINHNTLDNRRSNLRKCTHQENMWNRKKSKGVSSQYMGVSYVKLGNKWDARIYSKGRSLFIGYFPKEKDAAVAWDRVAKELRGQYASLNFPYQPC